MVSKGTVERNTGIEPIPTALPVDEQPSLEEGATLLQKLFMSYLNPLLQTGATRRKEGLNLEHEDLGGIAERDACGPLYAKFAVHWEASQKAAKENGGDKPPSLWGPLIKVSGGHNFILAIFLQTVTAAATVGPILILDTLVRNFSGQNPITDEMMWTLVALLLVMPVIGALCSASSTAIMTHIGCQVRNSLINAIFRKSLRLSPAAKQKTSTGMIVNMFSGDTKQIQSMLFFIVWVILAPLQIAVALVLIYEQVGVATFVGLGFMFFLIPIQGFIMVCLHLVRRSLLKFQDKRVKLMNEILTGIRVLKYYAWEKAFSGKVVTIRDDELVELKKMAYILAVGFSMLLLSAPVVQPILVFFAYIRLDNQLDAAKAFTTIALFNLMRFPFAFLPMGLAQWTQSRVSMARIREFLMADELDDQIKTTPEEVQAIAAELVAIEGHENSEKNGDVSDVVVVLKNASMGWLTDDDVKAAEELLRKEQAAVAARAAQAAGKKGCCASSGAKEKYVEAPQTETPDAEASAGVEMGQVAVAEDGSGGNGKEGGAEEIGPNRGVDTLTDISLMVRKGELLAVVGTVGSGKSSLLNALIGELHLKEGGAIGMTGRIAYCDQKPWILNASLRENVMFGLPFDEARFDMAVHASSLEDDLAVLPGGAETEIGERGINLSGGQKARVALARAVYRDSDLYLLDDPLSAVDAHVCDHLFRECIKGALKGKTIILVTHQAHLLSECDKVAVLDKGRLVVCDTYDALMKSELDLDAYLPEREEDEEEGKKKKEDEMMITAGEAGVKSRSQSADLALTGRNRKQESMDKAVARKIENKKETKLMTVEERNVGHVDMGAYTYYLRAGGLYFFLAILVVMTIGKCCELVGAFHLATWSERSVAADKRGTPMSSDDNMDYLNMYAVLSCSSVAAITIRAILSADHRVRASRTLHKDLLTSVMQAPTSFFDVTPLGRVLNRFSSDMQAVDEQLSSTISQLINTGFNTVQALGGVVGATKGTILVLFAALTYIYVNITKYFQCTSTEIQRLQSTSMSPIYAEFSQALTGMASIRAFNDQGRFIQKLEERANVNTISQITVALSFQWLSIRLDFFGALVSFFVGCLAAATAGTDFIPAGYVGLGLACAFDMTGFLKHGVRMAATAETEFNAVERIMHYIETLEDEFGPDAEKKDPPADWPSEGRVVARNVTMGYRDGPDVLKGLTFDVPGGNKVGICGRTGSGKSSLMVALFSIEKLRKGDITIDGVDCVDVPLHILRRKLGIIPQDPVMFSASVRFNLDPFNDHSDEAIWNVLDRVDMKGDIMALPSKLLEEVAEGGENFSAGQRQLICIARALLRNPKILVLDEATASVDNETDTSIQAMIREQFSKCTVLTIAHRLHTIIDCDRVMVLVDGYLGEYDAPGTLLTRVAAQDDDGSNTTEAEASLAVKGRPGVFKALWDRHQLSHRGEVQSAMKKVESTGRIDQQHT